MNREPSLYQDSMEHKEFLPSHENDRPLSPTATLTPGSPRSGFKIPYSDDAGEYNAVPTTEAESQRRIRRKRWTLGQLMKLAMEGDRGKRFCYATAGILALIVWLILITLAARYRWRTKAFPNFEGKLPAEGTQEIAIHIWVRQYDPVVHEISVLYRPFYIDHLGQPNKSPDLPDISLFLNSFARSRNRTRSAAVENWDGDSTYIGLADAKEGRFPVNALTQNAWQQLDYGYPFDEAESISQWAATSGEKEIPIAGVILEDAGLNNKVHAKADKFERAGCGVVNSTEPCYFQLKLETHRPRYVMLNVVAVVTLNWLITIFLFILASESRGVRRYKILEGTDELSVFFSALFALPGVRSLLPGIPSAGCLIDLIGIIPNTVIIAACAIWMSIARISGTSKDESEDKEA